MILYIPVYIYEYILYNSCKLYVIQKKYLFYKRTGTRVRGFVILEYFGCYQSTPAEFVL